MTTETTNEESQFRWDAVREALMNAERDGSGVWWDDDEIRDAIHEAARKGIDIKLILACREACASSSEFLSRVRSMNQEQTAQRGKRRILAIDDETGFLATLAMNLEDLNFEVRAESDPKVTLEVACEFNPDIILLDIVMPEVDGLQLLSAIRQDEELKNTRIIMLTALAAGLDAGGVTDHGTLFLAKPVSMSRLVHCINEHLLAV
ncbi:MAG: CheY-like chemotaxis protein [Verrucomicrobiales bacterium]|jgi:CheY-like chemotaxis protein